MQQVELYAICACVHSGLCGLQHHFFRLSRQAQDNVGHHFNPRCFQPFYRVEINLGFIAPTDVAGGFFVNGLQSQFHGHRLDVIDLGKKLNHICPQTVGSCTDRKAHDLLRGDGFQIAFSQMFHRGVGIGEGLKIGNVFSVFVFLVYPELCPLQLFCNGRRAAFREFSAAGAEDTAFGSEASVPVGTGETAVQR